MLKESRPFSFQNRLLPQTPQYPRSALSDDRYQRSAAEDVKVMLHDGALVIAA